MSQERETPKFSEIADPRCRCTPVWLCRWCCPPGWSDASVSYSGAARFRGKFREPWNIAVRKNNDGIKNEEEK